MRQQDGRKVGPGDEQLLRRYFQGERRGMKEQEGESRSMSLRQAQDAEREW